MGHFLASKVDRPGPDRLICGVSSKRTAFALATSARRAAGTGRDHRSGRTQSEARKLSFLEKRSADGIVRPHSEGDTAEGRHTQYSARAGRGK